MTLSVFDSHNEQDTIDFAIMCAKQAQKDDIFLLQGPLGAGKSVFARAFIQYLMKEKIDVPSPTFTLVQTYSTTDHELWHFDLYRLEQAEEVYELGWEEAAGCHLLLIEWPEQLGHLKPSEYKQIIFNPDKGESRKITFEHVTEGNQQG